MQPQWIPLSRTEAAPAEAVDRFVEQLAQGQVVALPTETCFGLAIRGDRSEAIQRLAEIKGRPADRVFTWHLGDGDSVLDWAPWKALTGRLIQAYWPGPLTLVLPIDASQAASRGLVHIVQRDTVGVRVPQHAAVQSILSAADFPVLMTSANVSGQDPLRSAQEVAQTFGDSLALVGDDGAPTPGYSSTVLAVGAGRFDILRTGRLALEDLRATAGLRILFVCTGNTCRSPMAEALARHHLGQCLGVAGDQIQRFGFQVASAGVYAGAGAPASQESVVALQDWGLDLRSHQSNPISEEILRPTDRIYCLTRSHRDALLSMLDAGLHGRVELLCAEGQDIPDPIGGPLEYYRETRDAIDRCIQARLRQWI